MRGCLWMRSLKRECMSNSFQKHQVLWFRLECSMCCLCSTCCIVDKNKEQNQNASWHTYFKRISWLSLGALLNPSSARASPFCALGGVLQQVPKEGEQWVWGSVPLDISSQLCILWGVRARKLPALLPALVLPVLGQISSVSPASVLLGLWSGVAVPWHWLTVNHGPAANLGFEFGYGSPSRLCFSLEKSCCSPCSVVF